MKATSLIRYNQGPFAARSAFIRLCAWLQGKDAVILDRDPLECARALASSETKGDFIETIFAIPAWRPLYSVESEDGARWKVLAENCARVLRTLRWKESIPELIDSSLRNWVATEKPTTHFDSECVSRLVLRTLYEVLFDEPIRPEDETLFYQSSVEWRKEIAVKGSGDRLLKQKTAERLLTIIEGSRYRDGLDAAQYPMLWLSVFGQPFIISPQINVSDIMVATFGFLHKDPALFARVRAGADDSRYLNAVIMEAIRLQHPFPILERELTRDLVLKHGLLKAGTQIFVPLDQFKQDQTFQPEDWLRDEPHPFQPLIFGAGKRMCPGRLLASQLMVALLRSLVLHVPAERIRPDLGHRFSGRSNDGKESFRESLYQLQKFWGALQVSYRIGRLQRAQPKKLSH